MQVFGVGTEQENEQVSGRKYVTGEETASVAP